MTLPKQKPWHVLRLLLIALLLAGCRSTPIFSEIETLIQPVSSGQRIEIELAAGQVELRGHTGPLLEIAGFASQPEAIQIEQLEQLILVSSGQTTHITDQLMISVPAVSDVKIQIGSGSLLVHDLQGQLWIETVSASIRVEQFRGDLLARTRRGSIKISDSMGKLDAIAEADDIELRDVSGQVSGTNIMGEIYYESLLSTNDRVRLETDHGGVHVALSEESHAKLELNTASGPIVCTLPGKSGTGEQCEGPYGNAGGVLWIRTVSGPIRIESMD